MTRPEMLAADHIRELIQGFTTGENVTQPQLHDDGKWRPVRKLHVVKHPALLDQIEQTVTGTTKGDDVIRGGRAASKPAGRLDCMAYLNRIERQSHELARELGIPRLPLRKRLSAISGALGDRPHKVVKGWWASARVLTQHDSPPFAPNVQCPECDALGTLRIRFSPQVATCVDCHGVWDDDEGRFGRLAIWCEWAAEHLRGPRHLIPVEGYDPDLGYVEPCTECETERQALAQREADKLLKPRRYDHGKPADEAVAV